MNWRYIIHPFQNWLSNMTSDYSCFLCSRYKILTQDFSSNSCYKNTSFSTTQECRLWSRSIKFTDRMKVGRMCFKYFAMQGLIIPYQLFCRSTSCTPPSSWRTRRGSRRSTGRGGRGTVCYSGTPHTDYRWWQGPGGKSERTSRTGSCTVHLHIKRKGGKHFVSYNLF